MTTITPDVARELNIIAGSLLTLAHACPSQSTELLAAVQHLLNVANSGKVSA